MGKGKDYEEIRKQILADLMCEDINIKSALIKREHKKFPWELDELKELCGKSLRSSELDSIERHAWKLHEVENVSRVRTWKKHEFKDEIFISLNDDTNIFFQCKDNTFVVEKLK